jgi:hypothetical protein
MSTGVLPSELDRNMVFQFLCGQLLNLNGHRGILGERRLLLLIPS